MNRHRYNSLTSGLLTAAGFELTEEIVLDFHAYPDRLVATMLADEDDDNAYVFDEQPELWVKDVVIEVSGRG